MYDIKVVQEIQLSQSKRSHKNALIKITLNVMNFHNPYVD